MIDIIIYGLFILSIIFSLYAQIKVSTTFNKYSKRSYGTKTAAQVAQMILSSNGVYDVNIEMVGGHLTDHYDPRAKVLRLSESVYNSTSAAAVGVAAHEAGHALQHESKYLPVLIRGALVPITNFASRTAWLVILLGAFIGLFAGMSDIGYYVVMGGILLFAVTALFQLVTLPCEFDASARAMNNLKECGWYSKDELQGSRRVLTAAALTYVAALFVTVLQLLRLILIFGRNRDR